MSIYYNGVLKTIDQNKNRQALDASITIRISSKKKKELEEICDKLGMTISTAINAFVDKVINLKALPFTTNNYKRKRKLFIGEGKYNTNVSDEEWKRMDEEIVEMFNSDDEYEYFA